MKKLFLSLVAVGAVGVSESYSQTLINSDYTQNFNSLGAGLPTSWTVRTGASATSLGSAATFSGSTVSWADTAGAFKNLAASTGLTGTESTTTQNAQTNRALGIRQTGSFGDAGASFNFNFATTGQVVDSITIDLMMLSVQTRSTTWSLQYGLGATPASFVTLGSWTDPGAFGSTPFNFTSAQYGTNLNDQSNIWFRVVALSPSSGSGTRDSMGLDNFAINVTPVPEPSTYALLGVGAAVGLWVLRRRRSA
jgi:hypothetical protein